MSVIEPNQALLSITEKRRALERLIKIASSTQSQQKSLSEIALAGRPSQNFPKSMFKYFSAIEKRLSQSDSKELLDKMETVEKSIAKSVDKIIALAKLDFNQLRDDEVDKIDVDSFSQFIEDFSRKTKTSLALRYILKKRHMAIESFKLHVSQEQIAEQIDELKDKERQCIGQIRKEITTIIKDSEALLKNNELPEAMREELDKVKRGMQVNIAHLDRGGSIDKLPNTFEIITLQSAPEVTEAEERPPAVSNNSKETEDKLNQQSATGETKKATQQSVKETKSYWWLIKTWLRSPWGTRWRDLKAKHRH